MIAIPAQAEIADHPRVLAYRHGLSHRGTRPPMARVTISVTCACGKRLRAAPELVGKCGRCPRCGSVRKVPNPLRRVPHGSPHSPGCQQGQPHSRDSQCPHCRSEMPPSARTCIRCGCRMFAPDRLQATGIGVPTNAQAQPFRVTASHGELMITRNHKSWIGLTAVTAALALGAVLILGIWDGRLVAGFGIALLGYAGIFSRKTIAVDRRGLSLAQPPLPWRRKNIPLNDVERLYYRKQYRSNRPSKSGLSTYELWLRTVGGRKIRIASSLPNEDIAHFLTQQIRHFLATTDFAK